jgi:hypothetical protein
MSAFLLASGCSYGVAWFNISIDSAWRAVLVVVLAILASLLLVAVQKCLSRRSFYGQADAIQKFGY